MNSRKANVGRPSSPRVIRDNLGGAPTLKRKKKLAGESGAFVGFLMGVSFQAVLFWVAVRVLRSAGAVEWSLGVWHALALSALYLLWRSFYSYLFSRMDSYHRSEQH